MDDETHRYVDKSMEAANAQNDARFTKASSEVKDVQAEMSVTKTELGAKVDGVNVQVDSLKTEMTAQFGGVTAQFGGVTAKFDGVTAKFDGVTAQFDGVNKKLDGINPVKSWQIIAALVACFTLAFTIAYVAFMYFGNVNFSYENRKEIAEIVAEALAQREADGSLDPRPAVVPEIQEPEASGSGSLQNEEQ